MLSGFSIEADAFEVFNLVEPSYSEVLRGVIVIDSAAARQPALE